MAFEFLLLALIDGQEPMVLQRYDRDERCIENVEGLTDCVDNNYTELQSNLVWVKAILDAELKRFNENWEGIAIEVPAEEIMAGASLEWVKSISDQAFAAVDRGIKTGLDDLVLQAGMLQSAAEDYLENAKKPTSVKTDTPKGFIAKNRIEYVCIAAPVE